MSSSPPSAPVPARRLASLLLFGATGMVGQAVLRQAVAHPSISRVHVVTRTASPLPHPKVTSTVVADLFELGPHTAELSGFDALVWCVGVSSAGLSEAEYSRVTCELTLYALRLLLPLSPSATVIFVSGEGADSSESSRVMWARVKGRTENGVLALSPSSFVVRPGVVLPLHGITSRTASYRVAYQVGRPLFWLLKALRPQAVSNTTELGDAVLRVAEVGYRSRLLRTADIREVGQAVAAERRVATSAAPPITDSA